MFKRSANKIAAAVGGRARVEINKEKPGRYSSLCTTHHTRDIMFETYDISRCVARDY